jgi:sugar transferase (PEP-CTERM/EpsH1 system associated)
MNATPAAPQVTHVIFRLDYGGLENGLVNLVNRMPADRYRHSIVCLAGYGAEFRRRIRRDDVEIVWEASDPCGRNPRSLRIRRACRPVIHRYVPMSQDIARWLETDVGVASERIRQAYSGVDTIRFQSALARGTADHSSRGVRIGTMGRLDPVKNHASLLRALRAILDRRPDLEPLLRLIIVGDGPLRPSLEAQARTLGLAGHVEFMGTRDDTPEIMRTLDVFVLPSLNEGISNTILEAMASSLPVIAARVGGNPELVVDGVTGLLYEADAQEGLERGLLHYLDDPARRRLHGQAGRERVLASFGLDAMVQRYMDIYDELTCAA